MDERLRPQFNLSGIHLRHVDEYPYRVALRDHKQRFRRCYVGRLDEIAAIDVAFDDDPNVRHADLRVGEERFGAGQIGLGVADTCLDDGQIGLGLFNAHLALGQGRSAEATFAAASVTPASAELNSLWVSSTSLRSML